LTDTFNAPDPAPLLQAATAAGEIAFLQAQATATKPDAENSIDKALTYLDAMAPSYAAALERQTEANKLGTTGLREKLKQLLQKKTDDQARQAANSFNRKLDEIVRASLPRFEIETNLLSRLRGAGIGLDTKVWIIVNSRATADDVDHRENFMLTRLPGELVEGLKGNVEAQAIIAAWKGLFQGDAPPRPPAVVFNELLKNNVKGAVEFIQSVETKDNQREELVLEAASWLPTLKKLETAFQFIAGLDDKVTREDCYLLTAAQAARLGQAAAVLKQVGNVNEQTEKVALCRGMIAGLQAMERKKYDLAETP
jgi:hypothetical protein